MKITKQFNIPKKLFVQAFNLVKKNAGSAGIDQETLEDFERNLKDNLYKLWNRMSSGSYFPPPVMAVSISKKSGGERILGVPTVGDRICQMVVKLVFEPQVETTFLPDSYGYRPNKSALDAIGITRQRCWKYDWCVEFDIKSLFDNLDHDLLMKAVKKHTDNKWIILYIERWLVAPVQQRDGKTTSRSSGVPQGSVIGPVLSNLFLHYTFDLWMTKNHKNKPWCRYADDGLAHCKTKSEAEQLLLDLTQRFAECGLEVHPDKSKIIYCKDGSRKGNYTNTKFEFLGYCFRARKCKNTKRNSIFINFTPAVSDNAIKSMRAKTRKDNIRNRTDLNLNDIARWYNPIINGWLNYYASYSKSAIYPVLRHFNKTLVAWAMRKYRRFRHRKTRAALFIEEIAIKQPNLFAHWKKGMVGAFA